MTELTGFWEEDILSKITIKELILKFDPEIQAIFFSSYGNELEAIPKVLLSSNYQTEYVLEGLLNLRNTRAQKIILMRFGIVTGKPMTLEEVANILGITRERVRQIESAYLRRLRPHIRRRRLVDYLND